MLVTMAFSALLAGSPLDLPVQAKKKDEGTLVIAPGSFAVGFQVGSPTGLTGKLRLDPDSAAQAAVSFGYEGFEITADYVHELGRIARSDNGDTSIYAYLGLGGRISAGQHNDTDFGPRVPFGLDLRFASVKPLEVYLEIAPGLVLATDVEGSLDGALGVRWYL